MLLVKSKKEILRTLVCVSVGIAVGVGFHFMPYRKTFGQHSSLKIVVDAGHGLPDGGTVGVDGTIEEKINLAIALKIKEVLNGRGIEVIMTRTTEDGLSKEENGKSIREMKKEDMHKRKEIMEKSGADLFVSIHMNYFESEKVEGLRLFYDKKHEEGEELARYIQERMGEVTGAKMYAVKAADEKLFLMKNPSIPAVLIECGFLSNREEEKKLNDEEYQSKIAWAIATSLEKYFER